MSSSNIVVASGSPGPVPLALNGMQVPIVVSGPTGQRVRVTGAFDTESTISSVNLATLQAVGAQQVGQTEITTVMGSALAPVYNAGIGLPLPSGAVLPLMIGLPGELGDQLGGSLKVLIGNDIMSKLILLRNGPAGTFSISVPASTPMPYMPPGSSVNPALYFGVGGLVVALGALGALFLVSRNERREIAGLRRDLTQEELRRRLAEQQRR